MKGTANNMPEQRVRTSEMLRRLIKTENINQFIKRNSKNMKSTPFHLYINQTCSAYAAIME